MPFDVKGEAGFIDPTIEPSAAVGLIEVLRSKSEEQFRIILREEQILTTVIKVILGHVCAILDQSGQFLSVGIVIVDAGILELLTFLDGLMSSCVKRATLLIEARDVILVCGNPSHLITCVI